MTALDDALTEELLRRSRLNGLVRERASAVEEARRLRTRAELPGASPDVAATAGRWEAVAERLAADVEAERAALRAAEGEVARLRGPEASG